MSFYVLTTKLIKNLCLLDCYVMLSSKYKRFLTFQRNIMYPSLWSISQQAKVKNGKAVPLQAWNGPEGSRKLRFPDYMTTAQYGGKVVSLTHQPPVPPGNAPGTHFCQRLSRPQGHSAI
jgi:hypothetical protein